LYADKKGNIYRREVGDEWQILEGKEWKDLLEKDRALSGRLDREEYLDRRGETRTTAFKHSRQAIKEKGERQEPDL